MSGRYIKIQAVKIGNSEYIPFWKLYYEDTEEYGSVYRVRVKEKGDSCFENHYNLVECYWDIKKQKIIPGKISKDIYPEQPLFKINQIVYIESDLHHSLKVDKIKDIVFKEYESMICKVGKMDIYYFKKLSKKEKASLDLDDLVEFKIWIPYYVMESGVIIKWEHELYSRFEDK